jgi:putative FmdB family regulatory protein
MPFYEYECPHCKYYAEVLQKLGDRLLKKCPSCGKAGFRRLVSAPVFRLKGSGWYETDFKSEREDKRNLAGAEHEEAKAAAPAPAGEGAAAQAGKSGADPAPAAPAEKTEKPAEQGGRRAGTASAKRPEKAAKPAGSARATGSARAAKPQARRAAGRPRRNPGKGRGRR